MTAQVVVVGGGYGGVSVAKELDEVAEVTLVEPRDAFVHNVAALRGLVDPDWTERLFLPYDRLLARGRVVRERARLVEPGVVTLGSGERITADHVVLATGSGYPFPAKFAETESAGAIARLRETRVALERAGHAFLLGAGAVGLELAGEIKAVWPGKRVTVVDPQPDILSGGYSAEFRAEIRRQLDGIGVELRLGTTLRPPSEPNDDEIWFRCYGVQPVSDYLSPELAAARTATGALTVTEHLNLPGHPGVFAIGDLTAIGEGKTAMAAAQHAEVVVANLRAELSGSPERVAYRPGPAAILLPLGPAGGAGYVPDQGVLGTETAIQFKSAGLRLDSTLELLGLAAAHS